MNPADRTRAIQEVRLMPLAHQFQPGLSIVVPCHNEDGAVQKTIDQMQQILAEAPFQWEAIFINDGSSDDTGKILDDLAVKYDRLRVLHNRRNCGYGATLKRGILSSRYDRLVISDADGTYPIERIPDLAGMLDDADMVIGARDGQNVPRLRRPAKWALLRTARWISGADIKDLNSGLRAMRVERILPFWNMLPNGFSFTTTITLAMHVSGYDVRYVPIDYHKRVGKSTIRPVRDTFNFFMLVFRTIMYFKPLPFFGALSLILVLAAAVVAVVSKLLTGLVADVTAMTMFATGLIFLGLGLLGDLINARRPL